MLPGEKVSPAYPRTKAIEPFTPQPIANRQPSSKEAEKKRRDAFFGFPRARSTLPPFTSDPLVSLTVVGPSTICQIASETGTPEERRLFTQLDGQKEKNRKEKGRKRKDKK
jgi:hypothetical protein